MSQQNDQPDRKTSKQVNNFLKYTGLGLQMVVTLALAGALGYYIDTLIGWKFPVFLLVFLMGALAGTIYLLIKRGN